MDQIKKLHLEELEPRIAPSSFHASLDDVELMNPTRSTVDSRIDDAEAAGHQNYADRTQNQLDRIAHKAGERLDADPGNSAAILNETSGRFSRILSRLNNLLSTGGH